MSSICILSGSVSRRSTSWQNKSSSLSKLLKHGKIQVNRKVVYFISELLCFLHETVTNSEVSMGRGGARLGAGAKSKWNSNKTKTIRVPEILVDKILKYAIKLDKNEIIENVSESNVVPGNPGTEFSVTNNTLNLSKISIHRSNGKSFIFIEDLIKAGYEIQPSKLAVTVLDEIYKSQLKGANTNNAGQKRSFRKDT